MTSENQYLNTISNTLSYSCLLACGLYFSRDAFYQYQEGKTAFQTTVHTMTLDDLPLITICYEGLQYDMYKTLRFNNSAITEDWLISYMVEILISNEVSGSDTILFWDEQREHSCLPQTLWLQITLLLQS